MPGKKRVHRSDVVAGQWSAGGDGEVQRYVDLDARLVAAARPVRVLSRISWSLPEVEGVLDAFHRGRALPAKTWQRVDHAASRQQLEQIMAACDRTHPLGRYVHDSAASVATAAAVVESAGTPAFAAHAGLLYGAPADRLVPKIRGSTLTAAKHLLQRTEAIGASCAHGEGDYCILAETVAGQLRLTADEVFGPGRVAVQIEPTLAARAAASARRIRLRSGTCFSSLDAPQLIEHELLVHTLTAANGQEQPRLRSLGLGLPRTTRTQEGLAVFAEFISSTMDVSRLRRIAARVVGIDMALEGADMFEVCRFFVETGQTDREAVQSAARVFRGTDGRGGSAFTKDLVYLQGFVRVHDFFRRAIEDDDFTRAHRLFAGRLTTGDVRRLALAFDAGVVGPPARVPPWMQSRATLAAFLVYDALVRELHVGSLVDEPAGD